MTIKEGAEDFFLDFHGEVVTSLKINDAIEKDFQFSQHKIHLLVSKLKVGELNKIEVSFVNTYVTNSAGLHRFQDPEDY